MAVLQFDNSGTGTVTLASPTSGNYSLTFPSADGTATYVFQTDVSGNLSFVSGFGGSGLTGFTCALSSTGVNATINVVSITPSVTSASGAISTTPVGAFLSFSLPDGTTTGGNTRGTGAVDYCLPSARRTAADVASGAYSVLAAYNSTANGDYSVVLGGQNNTTSSGNGHQVLLGCTNVNQCGAYSTLLGVNYYNGTGQYSAVMCGNAPYSALNYSWTVGGYGGDSYSNTPSNYGRTQITYACYNAITTNATTRYLTTDGGVATATSTTSSNAWTPTGGGFYYIKGYMIVNGSSGVNAANYVLSALAKYDSGTSTIAFIGTPTATQTQLDAGLTGIAVAWGVDNTTTKTFWISVNGLAATSIGWNCWLQITQNKPVGA